MKKIAIILVLLSVFTTACAPGVSQAEYDAVVAELDALKAAQTEPVQAELVQAEPAKSEPTPAPTPIQDSPLGSRKNAAKAGDTIVCESSKCIAEVTLVRVIRGDAALTLAKEYNKFNEVEPGKEIIMATFSIKNIKDLSGKDEAVYMSSSRFRYADSTYAKSMSLATVASAPDDLASELYEGSEVTGTIFLEAEENEKQPYAVYEDDYWFDISGR